MPKTLKEAAVTTKAARAKLPVGVHWRGIDAETHLGYRRGKRSGTWLVRWRHGVGYRQKPLGSADDELSEGTLDYEAARRAARSMVDAERAAAKARDAGPLLTVGGVVKAYIATRDARDSRRKGRAIRSDAAQRLGRYVLEAPLADIALHAVKETDLSEWRASLPTTLKATTRHRTATDFRAALNAAVAAHRERLPASLPSVIRYGLQAEHIDADETLPVARENQILTDVQVGAILRAARQIDAEEGWEGDLFRLVTLLAATGARFSQVARLKVRDLQRAQGRVMIPASRKGRGGAKAGAVPVPLGKDVLDALQPATTGRAADEPLLTRWKMRQVGRDWVNDHRGPWQTAGEMVKPWHAIRQRAGLPGAVPYSLRHSSIVRGLRANLPIRLVAAMHNTSVQMIEAHYGLHVASGLEDMARAALVPLMPADESNVVQIGGRSPAL